jgi:serine/threonine-protein kinase
LAHGLARAHGAGIFHRDLKPANIMLNKQGELKIVDFGLAKLAGQQDLTKDATTIGTIAYMSPEQAKGQSTDHRTDIWSFGVILYELLTASLPFKGDYDQAIIYSVLNEEPDMIQITNKEIPNEFLKIISGCLVKDPNDRFSSIDDIIEILNQDQTGSITAHRIRSDNKVQNVLHRIKNARSIIFILLFFIVIFGFWEVFLTQSPPRYLVVLPFQAIGKEPIDNFYRDGILELINSKLTQLEQFQQKFWVISGAEVRKNNLTSIAEARDIVGADLAITGSVSKLNSSLRYTINLVDAESFVQMKSVDLTIKKNMASLAESHIIDNIVAMLNLEIGSEQRSVLYAGGTASPDAYEYYVRGRGYLTRREENKNLDTAISLFKRALSSDSTFLLVQTGLGEAYWRKYENTKNTQFAEMAKQSCQKAIRLGYQHPEVNITCGIIYRGIGEYEKAIMMLNEAMKLDPENATAMIELGLAHLLSGNLELSRYTFEMAIEKRPGYWQGHSYLGYYFYSIGDYENALKQYQQIVELIPHSDVGYKKLAAMYFYLNDSEKFISASQRAIEIKPSYGVINNLAVYYYYSGDYSRAATMFKEVLKFKVKDYLVYGNIATASFYSNQQDSALAYYKIAVEIAEERRRINPRDNILLSNLAGYYVKLEDKEKATELLDDVIDSEPKNINVIFNLGDVFEQMGERDKALFWMEKAIKGGATLTKFKSNPGLSDLIADERFNEIISNSELNN